MLWKVLVWCSFWRLTIALRRECGQRHETWTGSGETMTAWAVGIAGWMSMRRPLSVWSGYGMRELNVRERRNKGEFVVATTCGGAPIRPETGVRPASPTLGFTASL